MCKDNMAVTGDIGLVNKLQGLCCIIWKPDSNIIYDIDYITLRGLETSK